MLSSELGLKSVAGAIAGAVLGAVSAILGPPSMTTSYLLVILYLVSYPVSVMIIRIFGRGTDLKKGVSVFYSLEFIFWAGIYEALCYASMMR